MSTNIRLSRKKKKVVRQCSILDSGNGGVRLLHIAKRRWVTVFRGYKVMASRITLRERRECNLIIKKYIKYKL